MHVWMKKWLFQIIRAGVSLGLLAYLIYIADWHNIYATVRGLQPGLFVLAIGAFLLGVVFLAIRWKVLLSIIGTRLSFLLLFRFYLIGYFFNNFLPTTIGGDVMRALLVAQLNKQRAESVGMVLMERLLGFVAILTLGAMSLFWVSDYFSTTRIIYLTVVLIFIAIAIFYLLFHPPFFSLLTRIFAKIHWFNLGDRLTRVFGSIHRFREYKIRILQTFVLSLISQVMFIVMNYLLAKALGLHQVSFEFLLLVIPAAFMLGLFPSINGLGVRDTGYVFLLKRIGLSPAEALSLSFLNTLVPMLVSVVGGVLFLTYRNRQEVQKLEEATLED